MGNYEKQAKIDIERHPEWTEEEITTHLYKMKIKDKMSDKFSYRKRRSEIFELIEECIDKTLLSSWCNEFVDIKNLPYGDKAKPWSRGLRSKQIEFIDEYEGVWWTVVDN